MATSERVVPALAVAALLCATGSARTAPPVATAPDPCAGLPGEARCREAFELLTRPMPSPEIDLTIRVVAHGEAAWRHAYLSSADGPDMPADACEAAGPLVLPQGQTARLLLVSHDDIHPWTVPELGIDATAIPGRVDEILVRVDVAGDYRAAASPRGRAQASSADVRVVDAGTFANWKRSALAAGC